MFNKRSAAALILLLPAPSIGVLAAMILFPDTTLGTIIYSFCKIWLVLLPAIWTVFIEKKRLIPQQISFKGIGSGIFTGILLSAAILILWKFFGQNFIDPDFVKEFAAKVGLGKPSVYLAAMAYWVLINSLIEEYLWRWFTIAKFKELVPTIPAIILAAAAFNIHHIIAMQLYFSWPITILAAGGIFTGAIVWSLLLIRYKSILPGYISHAIVDAAVFGIGYVLIFC